MLESTFAEVGRRGRVFGDLLLPRVITQDDSSIRRYRARFCIGFRYMRVDLFLKAIRLCPRRTLAQKICEAGRVLINGNSVKSSHAVKSGDEILLRSRTKLTRVRVLAVPDKRQISRKEAGGVYEVLSEESLSDEDLI